MITKEELRDYKNKMEDLTMRRTPDGNKIYGLEELINMAKADNARLRYITYLGNNSLELIRALLPAGYVISAPKEDGRCKFNSEKVMVNEDLFYGVTVVIDIVNGVVAMTTGQEFIYITRKAGIKED